MIIALDATGGDFYPQRPVGGAIQAVEERDDIELLLVGPSEMVKSELKKQGYQGNKIKVVDAPDIIGMNESPSVAVKSKQKSSIAIGLGLHAQGKCHAFVSAGNTGALLAASVMILGRIEGVLRPVIGSTFPTIHGNKLMLDVGANVDVKPEMLVQFGLMGKIFTHSVLDIESPKLGLLNVGEEEEKGRESVKKAFELLKHRDDFVGNIEGRDIMTGKADVLICDGFTGNILLKYGESLPENLSIVIKQAMIRKQLKPEQMKLVADVLSEAFRPFDYQLVGGVPFLGVNGTSLVCHGGSTPLAIKNAIFSAAKMVETKVNSQIKSELN
jgi:glycerol-3-phosphate acyltransferase PlsX